MSRRQHQVLAEEKVLKPAANKARDEAYHLLQRESAFNGSVRTWEPVSTDSPTFPNEDVKVQALVPEVLSGLKGPLTSWFDIEATKNATNCAAKADVVLDGEVILKGVPAETLLFIETQLVHTATMLSKVPVLDDAVRWYLPDGGGPARSDVVRNHKTQKVQKPIVLYHATPEHPAQTQLISEDAIIGHWAVEKLSGALTRKKKADLIEKANKLLMAVRDARSRANQEPAVESRIGEVIFHHLGW